MTIAVMLKIGGIIAFIVGMFAIAIKVFWWALDVESTFYHDKDKE